MFNLIQSTTLHIKGKFHPYCSIHESTDNEELLFKCLCTFANGG